jgi:hypothetical protein
MNDPNDHRSGKGLIGLLVVAGFIIYLIYR